MDKDEKENTTLTFDEIMEDKKYQAELDRRIQKGINTAKSNCLITVFKVYQKIQLYQLAQ